jgi:hypothetical protein
VRGPQDSTGAFTLSCASAVPCSTNPEVPSPFSLPSARAWPPALRGQWELSVRVPSPLCVVGPYGSSRSGVDANFFTVRETPEQLWGGFGRLAVELALYVRALRPGANGRAPLLPPNLDTTRVVICTVSCLNGRLPLAERAAVRSDLGSGLALDRLALSRGYGREGARNSKRPVYFWCG